MLNKKLCSVFILLIVMIGNIFADDILSRIDALVSYPDQDFSAEYSIVQDKPGQGTSETKSVIFRRDSDDKYLILILEPLVDKGKGYLKIGNNLWLYDPLTGDLI